MGRWLIFVELVTEGAAGSSALALRDRVLNEVFRPAWSEEDRLRFDRIFEELTLDEREAISNRLACAVRERLLSRDNHPLKHRELKTTGGAWAEFERFEDGSTNRAEIEARLDEWGRRQLDHYWVNVEEMLEAGEVHEVDITEYGDAAGKVLYRTFRNYIDGRIYEAESLNMVGYCIQHGPSHAAKELRRVSQVERYLRINSGLEDISFASIEKHTHCSGATSPSYQRLSEWLDTSLRRCAWSKDEVGAFWREVAELDGAGRDALMNLIVTGYLDRRVDERLIAELA